jgi:type IV secretion system protein VirB11
METGFLAHYLGQLSEWLEDGEVNEIAVNPDGRVWIERAGHAAMTATDTVLAPERCMRLARQIAGQADQRFSEDNPVTGAKLPLDDETILRSHIVMSPVVEGVAISLRRIRLKRFTLDDLEERGTLKLRQSAGGREDLELRTLLDAGRVRDFLREAVRLKKNILVSGGTSTGKTTILRALLGEASSDDRIVTIEDARELHPAQLNNVQLLASKRAELVGKSDASSLLESALRMRPDRIILGEVRGVEAFTFLEAINTGHPGSLSSIHADSPAAAFERLALMVLRATQAMSKDQITDYARSIIDIVIQIGREASGERHITEIVFEERT